MTDGFVIPVPQARLADYRVVVFSWIRYRSRAHRDRVNARVMADPRLQRMAASDMPFDGKRMFFGDFKSMVEF